MKQLLNLTFKRALRLEDSIDLSNKVYRDGRWVTAKRSLPGRTIYRLDMPLMTSHLIVDSGQIEENRYGLRVLFGQDSIEQYFTSTSA